MVIIAFRLYSSIMCDDEVVKIVVVLWRGGVAYVFLWGLEVLWLG